MCILKIERSHLDNSLVFVNANPHDLANYDIEKLHDLMEDCGFKDFTIACYNGLDNSIRFYNSF